MNHVCKKFSKGDVFDSLRDLIPAVSVRRVRTRQGEKLENRQFWALDDVSFEVKKGEAFGIIGGNGAGKSTILKLLSGIIKPTKGSVSIKGRLSALIEVGAGFHPDLTGRENIYLNGVILGMRREEIKTKFDEIVEFSDLAEFLDIPVKRYSSGMFARLGFSVAAHVEPDVLLVDEVISVGDYVFQKKCLKKMEDVVGSGATVIFISHNMRAVADLCDRCMLLEKGKVLTIGPTEKVVGAYLERSREREDDQGEKSVFISQCSVSSGGQGCLEFDSGQKALVEVEICARAQCEKLAVVVFLQDNNFYEIFNTSTERLGCGTFSLQPGETFRCAVELDLHLTHGMYHLGVMLYRYDIDKEYDTSLPAATIFVNPDRDVRGVVNLCPQVVTFESKAGGPTVVENRKDVFFRSPTRESGSSQESNRGGTPLWKSVQGFVRREDV
jgi:lipopolysaccharide transport system ATP-binding protein